MKFGITVDGISFDVSYNGVQVKSDPAGLTSTYCMRVQRVVAKYPNQGRLNVLGLRYLGSIVRLTQSGEYALWLRLKPGSSKEQLVTFFAAVAASTKKVRRA